MTFIEGDLVIATDLRGVGFGVEKGIMEENLLMVPPVASPSCAAPRCSGEATFPENVGVVDSEVAPLVPPLLGQCPMGPWNDFVPPHCLHSDIVDGCLSEGPVMLRRSNSFVNPLETSAMKPLDCLFNDKPLENVMASECPPVAAKIEGIRCPANPSAAAAAMCMFKLLLLFTLPALLTLPRKPMFPELRLRTSFE